MSEFAAEAPDTGTGLGLDGEAGTDPAADGTASAAPSVEAGAAPAWTPDHPDFQAAVAEQAAQVAQAQVLQILQGLQQGDGQQDGPPEFDLYDPEQLQAFLAYQQQQTVAQMQQLLAPILGQQQAQTLQEGTQRVHDIVQDIATREGDFTDPGKAAAADFAPLFLDQYERTYGPGPRAAEAAIQQSARVVRSIEQAAAAKAVEAYKNQLATVGGARQEPAGGGTAIQGGEPAKNLRELGRRFAEQQNALR